MSVDLNDVSIMGAALGFAMMGLGALLRPVLVSKQFDIMSLTAAGRNEVRAVYGGFGLALAGVLMVALADASLRTGICLTIAAALAGMAGGRVISAVLDRTIGRLPAFYLALEAGFAVLLYHAA